MADREIFKIYEKIFIEENHKVNLISKNDEQYLWEKHICDSLAMVNFFDKYTYPKELLDIGTGGGFPSVPLAIAFPEINITAIDSIAKKIRAVSLFKEKLNLSNLEVVCSRVENYHKNFECITSRAVSSLKNICEYALPKLKTGGYFVAYKSRKLQQESDEAMPIIKKYKSEIKDIISYELPSDEKLERYLIVIKKQ